MVKPDYNRDYYADLEISPTADESEIRKQFRKLALKYHPDRNPGKEGQFKDKFVIIQTAHEILTDETVRAKYDANRRRSHYPTASGVKGNPYQNVSKDVADQWGAPPKRNPGAPTRPTPTSTPYSSWGVPQQPKQQPPDPTDNLRAWNRMRTASSKTTHPTSANTSQKASRPQAKPEHPPPPPRPQQTAFQARQHQASFGTRRAPPPPPTFADEPPAKNAHYTHLHSGVFEETAANLKKPRPASMHADPPGEQFGDAYLENRQRTPYASHVGEKFNPFEGASPSRARSVRDGYRQPQNTDGEATPQRPQRQRSASVGDPDMPTKASKENAPLNGFAPPPNPRFQSTASARYSPRPPTAPTPGPPPGAGFASQPTHAGFATGPDTPLKSNDTHMNGNLRTTQTPGPKVFTVPQDEDEGDDDDDDDDDNGNPDIASEARFTRNSFDNINTRFVAQEPTGARYQFSAGSPTAPGDPLLRTKQRSRSTPRGRQSPPKASFAPPTAGFTTAGFTTAGFATAGFATAAVQPDPSTHKQSGFFPEQWAEIGPQNFVPPPTARPSVSPTRHGRSTKKSKPVRMTAGTAGMVDDEETSGEDRPRSAPAANNNINGMPSPNAMDIDTPPAAPATAQANGARAVNVEPSKPEWRAGDVNGVKPETTLGNGSNVPKAKAAAAGGSEDTEDIARPVFPEFLNQEPFMAKPTGLAGWTDVKTTLPFESQASKNLPFEAEKADHPPAKLPSVPIAPSPPAALAIKDLKPSVSSWSEYVIKFERYLGEWASFENKLIDHFSSRKKCGEVLGAQRFAWVNTRGDQGTKQYIQNRELDNFALNQWTAASLEHLQRIQEFSKYRDKMKKVVAAQ